MAPIRINTRTHTKEKPYLINTLKKKKNWLGKKKKKKKINSVSKIRVGETGASPSCFFSNSP